MEALPLEIARGVAASIAAARAPHGPLARQDQELAASLETLAARIFSIWAPGLDVDGTVVELLDPARVAALASVDPGPVRTDPSLVWAPVNPAEIVARAARSLGTPQVAEIRARLAREHGELDAAVARLREVRKGRSLLHRIVQHDDAQHRAMADATARVTQEQNELTAAWETLDDVVTSALAATPPLRVAHAAIRAAGVVHARLTTWELAIGWKREGTIGLTQGPSMRGRALLFAALVALRRATEDAFPGALGRVTAGGGATAGDPYRTSPQRDAGPAEGAAGERLVDEIIERARGSGLDASIGALLAHAGALGGIRRTNASRADVRDLFARLATGDDRADDPRAARTAWHRASCYALLDGCESLIARARTGCFPLDLRGVLCAAAVRLHRVRGLGGGMTGTCVLHGVADTLDALQHARGMLVSSWGDPGDRLALAFDVATYIRTSPPAPRAVGGPVRSPLPRGDLVPLLGEALRGTRFVEAVAEADAAVRGHAASAAGAADAESRITLWDQINVFTDSDAERALATQTKLGQELFERGRHAFDEIRRGLDAALQLYPAAAALYRLDDVVACVNGITVVKVHVLPPWWKKSFGEWRCEVRGTVAAAAALDLLLDAAVRAFGAMPSDSEILARHWDRRLDGP